MTVPPLFGHKINIITGQRDNYANTNEIMSDLEAE